MIKYDDLTSFFAVLKINSNHKYCCHGCLGCRKNKRKRQHEQHKTTTFFAALKRINNDHELHEFARIEDNMQTFSACRKNIREDS